MIRSFIAFAVVTLSASALTCPVQAADLGQPSRSLPRDVLIEAPSAIWTGWYAGGSAGYATGDDEAREIDGPRTYIGEFDGATFSFHAGWQKQFGRLVAGLEAEAGYLGLDAALTHDVSGGSVTSTADLSAYGALSGRVGFLITPAAMIYGRAGVVVAQIDGGTTQRCADVTLCGGAQSNAISEARLDSPAWGLLLGAGIEHQLSAKWLMRLEYKFMNFSDQLALPAIDGPGWEHDLDVHLINVGLSYRF